MGISCYRNGGHDQPAVGIQKVTTIAPTQTHCLCGDSLSCCYRALPRGVWIGKCDERLFLEAFPSFGSGRSVLCTTTPDSFEGQGGTQHMPRKTDRRRSKKPSTQRKTAPMKASEARGTTRKRGSSAGGSLKRGSRAVTSNDRPTKRSQTARRSSPRA